MVDKEQNSQTKNSFVKVFFFKYYKLITIFAILILIIASYYLILQPKYQEVSIGGRYNLSSLQQDLENRNEYLQKLLELNDSYSGVSNAQREKLKQSLPTESDIPGLLVQLESLAFSEGVFLSALSFSDVPRSTISSRTQSRGSRTAQRNAEIQEEETIEVADKLIINLDLFTVGPGNYEQIKSFLDAIESNLRIFDVDAVFFSPEQSNFSVNLVTYYLR